MFCTFGKANALMNNFIFVFLDGTSHAYMLSDQSALLLLMMSLMYLCNFLCLFRQLLLSAFPVQTSNFLQVASRFNVGPLDQLCDPFLFIKCRCALWQLVLLVLVPCLVLKGPTPTASTLSGSLLACHTGDS